MSEGAAPARRPAAPVGLVGATLLLWGLSTGVWPLGALLAAAYEWIRWRAPAMGEDLRTIRFVLRGSLLFAVAGLVLALVWRGTPEGLYVWLRWLPLAFAGPALLTAAAGGLRRARVAQALGAPEVEDDGVVDFSHVFAAVALAGAALGKGLQQWSYAAFAVLIAWALLARAQPAARLRALAMVLVAGLLGQALHVGIFQLQGRVEEWGEAWIAAGLAGSPDPARERTRIGDLGKVKLSDRIVLRVEASRVRSKPLLLREVTFDQYQGGEWRADRKAPRRALPRQGTRWTLSAGDAASERLVLRRAGGSGDALLPLPLGTLALEGLVAERVDAYPGDAVLARGLAPQARFAVVFDENSDGSAPDPVRDLAVPAGVAPLFAEVVREQGLHRATPADTAEAVAAFFARNFSYSLALGERGRALSDFLLRDRSGHCEYFATATVLLLRQAGIPARYVGGYSVQEYSERERAYVVRALHAHAWAIAFVDGRWVALDTTPAGWAQADSEGAGDVFTPLQDILSWWLQTALEAWSDLRLASGFGMATALALLAPAAALIVWRQWRARDRKRAAVSPEGAVAEAWAAVEARLAAAGHRRGPQETVRSWMRRLGSDPVAHPWAAGLEELAQAYYRARFDPAAPAAAVQDFLRQAGAWQLPPRSSQA